MTSLNEKIKQHYDRNQIFYNLFWLNSDNLGMHYGFWEGETKNLHEAMLNENKTVAEKLDIKKSDIVLDAGCGVGGTAIWLAKNYGVRVTGISLSDNQIKVAKKYAQKKKVDHLVSFYVKDFCNTGFSKESFTKIIAIESVCHTKNKEDFIIEAFRLLRRGGMLSVADFFIKEKLTTEEKKIIDVWCYGWEMPNLSTVVDFTKKLELSGFKNIKNFNKTKEIEPSSRRMYFVLGKFLRFILKILKVLRLRASYGGTNAVVSQYHAFKRKIVSYRLFLAEK